jgi:HAD superfamily hydrolase (TIGR01490 family)
MLTAFAAPQGGARCPSDGRAGTDVIRLTLFDLDHTLLDGDSDVLWCDYLIDAGVLDRDGFAARNAQMERDYRDGRVGVQAFCDFYVGTLTARTRAEWEPLRSAFLARVVAPRIGAAAHALVQKHADAGDLVVLTTATNAFITEQTAIHLGIEHLIATECELDAAGNFTGRTQGTLNMREGKVERLHGWLRSRGIDWQACEATFYSDSINDLPLLTAVRHAIAVGPDPALAAEAARRDWPVLRLHGPR